MRQQVYMEWNSPWCLRDSAPPLFCPLTAAELCGGTCLGWKSNWTEVLSPVSSQRVPTPLFFLMQVLICRNYRGDVDMSEVEHFMPILMEKEEEGMLSPILAHGGVRFMWIKHNNLYRIPVLWSGGLGVTCPLAQDSWAARGHTVQRMLSIFQKLQPGSKGHVARVGASWAQDWPLKACHVKQGRSLDREARLSEAGVDRWGRSRGGEFSCALHLQPLFSRKPNMLPAGNPLWVYPPLEALTVQKAVRDTSSAVSECVCAPNRCRHCLFIWAHALAL